MEDILKENEFNKKKNIESITAEITSVKTITSSMRIAREKTGMILSFISTFFLSLNCFYAKIILRAYPNDFDSIEFLFMRGLSIVIYGILHTYLTKTEIIKPKDLPLKFWFLLRANMNFFYNSFSISALWYLRASTVQIIVLLSPLIVLVLSYFILNESLYFRYLIGTFMCVGGSLLIILNENKSNKNDKKEKSENLITTAKIFLGVFLAFSSAFFYAFINIASKILANHRVSINNQMIYIGSANMVYSFIYIIYKRKMCLKLGYLIMCIFHGSFFYIYYICYNRALQLAPVSKVVIITYLQIVFVFILSDIFLGEKIYTTDVFGSLLMISYMVYNALNPIIKKKPNNNEKNNSEGNDEKKINLIEH